MRILGLSLLILSSSAFAGGEEVYNTVCKACHGEFGGKPIIPQARNLKTSTFKNAKGATLEGVLEVLEKGLPGTAMVAQLHVKPEDRKAVAAWIISQRTPPAPAKAEPAKVGEPKDDGTNPEQPAGGDSTNVGLANGVTTAQAPPPPPAPAPPKSISIEEAMALELQNGQALGLTVYKGPNLLRPGLSVLGLGPRPAKVSPGQDETVAGSMPPDGMAPSDDTATEAK